MESGNKQDLIWRTLSSRERTSCTLVFRVTPKNATFQSKVINLGLKTEAISMGNFPLDYPCAQEYFYLALHCCFLQ